MFFVFYLFPFQFCWYFLFFLILSFYFCVYFFKKICVITFIVCLLLVIFCVVFVFQVSFVCLFFWSNLFFVPCSLWFKACLEKHLVPSFFHMKLFCCFLKESLFWNMSKNTIIVFHVFYILHAFPDCIVHFFSHLCIP